MSESRPAAVLVLAAGEGKRMKSRLPKVLHSLCGRSMVGHALAVAGELDPERLVVVVHHLKSAVVCANLAINAKQFLKNARPAIESFRCSGGGVPQD